MAFDSKGLNDYIDVAQRIADFRERYPDGSLQPADPATPFEVREIKGVAKDGKDFTATFIVYTAAAYRSPHDERPGVGVAWEVFPGRTPYTLGSELMNAETSAWGRAIVAALASDSKRGVSSREEVRNRVAEREDEPSPQPARRKPSATAREPLGPPPGPRPLAELPRNRDGSVSVSRCTEEELELHGFLTGEKEAAHDALRDGAAGKLTPEDKQRQRHCSPGNPCREADCPQCTPGADLWEDTPAGPPLRVPREALSLPAQIAMHFDRLEIRDRDVRLGITAQLAGTGRIGSSKELTASQARDVLGKLSRCRDQAALRELLDNGVMADA
jgi:hypothetical protein